MNAFFVVLLACKSVDRGTFFILACKSVDRRTFCMWKKMCLGPPFYTPIKLQNNAFNSYYYILNFSLWILFVLDYLRLEITMPLIAYIWRRHGGTCKFGFEFYWADPGCYVRWGALLGEGSRDRLGSQRVQDTVVVL